MEIYCPSLATYQRLNTRCVMVGDVGVGGKNPIRIQSMTTTNTMDTENTIFQSIIASATLTKIAEAQIVAVQPRPGTRGGRLVTTRAPMVASILDGPITPS